MVLKAKRQSGGDRPFCTKIIKPFKGTVYSSAEGKSTEKKKNQTHNTCAWKQTSKTKNKWPAWLISKFCHHQRVPIVWEQISEHPAAVWFVDKVAPQDAHAGFTAYKHRIISVNLEKLLGIYLNLGSSAGICGITKLLNKLALLFHPPFFSPPLFPKASLVSNTQ